MAVFWREKNVTETLKSFATTEGIGTLTWTNNNINIKTINFNNLNLLFLILNRFSLGLKLYAGLYLLLSR